MCGRGVVSEECVRRNAYIIIISPHNERIHKRIPLNASGMYKCIQTDIDRSIYATVYEVEHMRATTHKL